MSQTRYIAAGWLVDGTGSEIQRNVSIAIRGGAITAIGPADEIGGIPSAEVEDFTHCTILPALVDCSLYLDRSPSIEAPRHMAENKADAEKNDSAVRRYLSYCHAHGVLGIADGSGATRNGKRAEFGAEYPVTVRQVVRRGNGDISGPIHDTSADDYLKIHYTADIEEKQYASRRFGIDMLARLIASKGDAKTVVVVNGREQVKEALNAGCDAIEQGYDMGEENIREMARRGVLWIPSVIRAKNGLDGAASGGDVCCRFSQRYVAPGKALPGAEAHWKKVLLGQLAQLGRARELGVETAVGTGAGTSGILHGESVAEEMKLFAKAGFSVPERIRSASEIGARFFQMDSLGALSVGKRATFLITRGTVQLMPRKLSYLEGIYIDGKPCPVYRKNPF